MSSLHELQARGDNNYNDDDKEQCYQAVSQPFASGLAARTTVERLCFLMAVHANTIPCEAIKSLLTAVGSAASHGFQLRFKPGH